MQLHEGNVFFPDYERSSFQPLAKDEIVVWSIGILFDNASFSVLSSFLSADEREKAATFVSQKNYERYIFCRGLLRWLISRYIQSDPQSIRFVYNEFGKPALDPSFTQRLEFNISHTGKYVVFAFSLDTEIGIDLEHLDSKQANLGIAKMICSIDELRALSQLPSHEASILFMQLLTRKEALSKAMGKGIFHCRDLYRNITLLRTKTEIALEFTWTVESLALFPKNHTGAIAYRGTGKQRFNVTENHLSLYIP